MTCICVRPCLAPMAAAWEAAGMRKPRVKPNYRRRVLRLPDLDHSKLQVLNSLRSPASRRVYEYAIDQFIAWYCSAFDRRGIAILHFGFPRYNRGMKSLIGLLVASLCWSALGQEQNAL